MVSSGINGDARNLVPYGRLRTNGILELAWTCSGAALQFYHFRHQISSTL